MLVIPFVVPRESKRGPVMLVLVLEKENLDRMKGGDPFDLRLDRFTRYIPIGYGLRDLDIVMAYEEDLNTVMGFREKQDLAGLLNWLQRGRKIEPGDLQPPVPLRRT